MGLLEELIILVKETIDEVNERNKPKPTAMPMPDRNEEERENLRRTLARRAAEARQAEQQAAEHAAAEQHADQERHRQAQERQRHHQKQVQAVHAAQVTRHVGSVDARRVARLVHQPKALREMVVLKEILDKPLALRRR
ncbi:MAG TPA: hypothetical protein VHX44_00500 [Planctomycetota bacterium]|nr:hypothetical protein [Planctomycetota bacterium]